MASQSARRVIGILILLISLIILIWGVWPIASEVRSMPVSPEDMQLPGLGILLPGWLWAA